MPERVVTALRERGHEVTVGPDWPRGNGPVSMVTVEESGLRTAAADPRVETTLAGVR